jgi:hypothetical protein
MRVLKNIRRKQQKDRIGWRKGVSPGTVKKDAWSKVYESTPENATIKFYVREANMASRRYKQGASKSKWTHKLPELCCGR